MSCLLSFMACLSTFVLSKSDFVSGLSDSTCKLRKHRDMFKSDNPANSSALNGKGIVILMKLSGEDKHDPMLATVSAFFTRFVS